MADEKKILKILEKHSTQLDRIEKLLKSETPKKETITSIKKSSKLTTSSLLRSFKEEKFFDQPKTLNDIVKKFDEESRIVKPSDLTMPLQYLVRNRDLSRIMKNGRWAYVKR